MKGFTLIELLVVVLIMGILASVALPQYQKAVEKSRIMALMPNLRTLKDSLERYYLANGVYPADSVTDLDIDIAGCTIAGAGKILCDGYCFNYTGGIASMPNAMIIAMVRPENCDLEYTSTTHIRWYLDQSPQYAGTKRCGSKIAGVCESLQGFVSE